LGCAAVAKAVSTKLPVLVFFGPKTNRQFINHYKLQIRGALLLAYGKDN
jgi:hypothetical protein